MRSASWLLFCAAFGLAGSTYACGGDGSGDDDTADGGGSSSSSSGHASSSSSASSSGQAGSSSSSSGSGQASSSSSGETSSSSSGEASSSSSGSSSGAVDAGVDASLDAGLDASDASDAADVVVPPVPGALQYLGRWGAQGDADGPTVSWPGAQLVVRFHGTGVTADIGQTGATIGTSRYDLVLDGEVQPPLAGQTAALVIANGAAQTYTLASGLDEADHVLRVVRRTEPQQGVNNFKTVTVTGANAKLLPPPARPSRYLEVLTESTTNGYGIDSPTYLPAPTNGGFNGSRACSDVSLYHDAYQSFPNRLAQHFGAELSLLGMSGIGLTVNSAGDTSQKFGVFYPRINPLVGGDAAANTWSSAAHPADAVLVLLGGEDFDDPDDMGPLLPHVTSAAGFEPDLGALVDAAHARNPVATVFLMVGPQIKDSYPSVASGWPAADSQQRTKLTTAFTNAANGRPYVMVKSFTENNDQSLETACEYHASEALHTQMLTQAVPWIQAALGW